MKQRVALITGASKGIGKAIAQTMHEDGYMVLAGFNKTKIPTTESEIKEIKPIHIDINSEESVAKAFEYIKKKYGYIDVLVNNAAKAQPKDFLDITDLDWGEMISVNLMGAVRCTRFALPEMINNRRGRIINVASIGGQWGGINQVHYAASKAALINFTQSIAKLYSKYGVTSNAISPGLIETQMIVSELSRLENSSYLNKIPLGRLGDVKEVADAVAFLASLKASYITGQTLNINGGMYFG